MNHTDLIRIKCSMPGDDEPFPENEEEEKIDAYQVQPALSSKPLYNSNSHKVKMLSTPFINPNSLKKQYTKYSSFQSPNSKLAELLHKRVSYFDVVKVNYLLNSSIQTKKIFQRFLCIGIDKTGLDSIEDIDEMLLNPKITFNYPNNEKENDLQLYNSCLSQQYSNIVFLKNSCFREAVKVRRFIVNNEEDFILNIFERNFFAEFKASFCLLQPMTPEDDQKSFIFGVQFDDLFVTVSHYHLLILLIQNTKNAEKTVFIYEKTYIFISNEPLCKLFEQIATFILRYKKLNFYQQLESFESLIDKHRLRHFQRKNEETSSESILEILQYFYDKSYPRYDEYISFQSNYSQLSMNYKHPNQSNEVFLASSYLCSHLLKHSSSDLLYSLTIRILLEQNLLFVIDNIQTLTGFVLGFYFLIQPFTWPFTVIPNLPLDLSEVIESPVPYIIGVLGDRKIAEGFKKNPHITSNIILFEKGGIVILETLPLPFDTPPLSNLHKVIQSTLSKAQYALSNKMAEAYEQACELMYKNFNGIIKEELSNRIETIIHNNSLLSLAQNQNSIEFTTESFAKNKYNDSLLNDGELSASDIEYFNSIQKMFLSNQKPENIPFAKAFSQTQIFAVFVDKMIEQKLKS